MPSVTRFEDLDAWRKARQLGRLIYHATGRGEFARDFALRDQMRRAAISVLSNVAEGFERGGNKGFRQFLWQASGSIGEVKAQLYLALDVGFLTQQEFEQLYGLASETGRLIGGLLRYLSESSLKGAKFRVDAKNSEL